MLWCNNLNMGSKIEEITARLHEISTQKGDLELRENVEGRETDKEAILEVLLRDELVHDNEVCVIPIVGMGGVGKTTLAQLAYHDDRSIASYAREINDLNLLQVKLKEKLSGKKFLLVLDDVWNENYDKWDRLCTPLRAGGPAVSCVRAACIGSKNFEAHPHVKVIGEEMVNRCRGLPLVAKALGGILRNELNHEAWDDILKSKIWDLPEEKSGVLPALKLSYHHLPSHLKQCFAYCAIFPKGYEFKKDELILLWMGEGFLQQTKGKKRMEDLGSKYFSELLSRSFFQQSSDIMPRFMMHDLIHDLAQSIAGNVCFNLEDKLENNENIFQKARHLSFIRQANEIFKKFEVVDKGKDKSIRRDAPRMGSLTNLQTLSKFIWGKNKCHIEELTMGWSGDFDDSRNELNEMLVLELLQPQRNLKKLTPFPCLESLRFEDMPEWEDWCFSDMVEECEGLFSCLRELRIRECPKLTGSLPNCLPSLAELEIFECPKLKAALPRLAYRISRLTCLREGFTQLLAALQKLVIRGCGEMTSLWENRFGLECLRGLESIDIWQCHGLVSLEEQRLPCNLKHLKIENCANLQRLPNGLQSLTCLEELSLQSCPKLESFPEMGLPPMLRSLVLQKCNTLNFPEGELPASLKQLKIKDCANLQTLPEGMMHHNSMVSNNSCCLEVLEIRKCSSLPSLPTGELPSTLKRLEIWDCRQFQPISEKMLHSNTALEHLSISNYPNMKILPGFLHSLTYLYIYGCQGLVSFPERGLPTPNLRDLYINNCENLKSLPHQMQNLLSLQELNIRNCQGLESFPECGLAPNLTSLSIRDV
ncbi:putative disease resistance RPP13-like protein 1 [Vitis vinifera]|uniref:Putative disease resistance RPP13-like protein 1 n=1 Tax=Vitis vinifera TaxID=29760 RepID=A0A438CPY3_VITVI|nr:putative disease resistance RPP13-like protein 1 [Vitis vinifera]